MCRILLLILVLCFCLNQGEAQTCLTPNVSLDSAMSHRAVQDVVARRSVSTMFTVRIMVHLLKSDEGAFGPAPEVILAELDTVRQHFAQADICFALIGIHDILSTEDIENWNEDTTIPELYNLHGSADRIDVFIVPFFLDFAGSAFDIPSSFLGFGEQRFGRNTMSHELGHALGLHHTHNVYDQYNEGEIADLCFPTLERVNGSNCTTAGDLICDTPADPELTFDDPDDSIDGCLVEGPAFDCNDDLFDPIFENLMAYSLGCRDQFTTGQKNRMHAELLAGTIGPPLLLPENISLTGSSYSSGTVVVWSGTYISHPASIDYSVTNTAKVEHKASDYVVLRAGFHAMPGTGGYYFSQINPLCN